MAILLQSIEIRHERRMRVLFTNSLAAGAFGVAPILYEIENVDGKGPSPEVQSALIVPNSPSVVELALSLPLVKGALYTLSAVGVPAVDATTTPDPSELSFRWGLSAPKENVDPIALRRQELLYGIDLVWTGVDFEESSTGDLNRITGPANVAKALNGGIQADNLPWDETWGGKSRQFVDSPSNTAGTLKGSVNAQILRDPRVAEVRTTYEIDRDKTYLHSDVKLISGEPVERVSVEAPNQ